MAGVLSAATLLASVAAFVATAMEPDRPLRRLVWARRACAAVAGLLVAGSVGHLVSGYALGLACIAALLSVSAMWVARRRPAPLQTYLDHLSEDGDAAWRAEFERPFDEYVRERMRT